MEIRALIVDDEHAARENLRMMIEEHCPSIKVLDVAGSAGEARELIEELKPNTLFLDIKMPGEDGFGLLRSLGNKEFMVVFTTAYDEFALQAFRENALDYLEKPIDVDALHRAEQKLLKMVGEHQGIDAANATADLIEQEIKGPLPDRISIASREGLTILRYQEILYLEASDSYTEIHLTTGKRLVSSKNIRVFEQHLSSEKFHRIHKSYIINLEHLKAFDRNEGNMAVLMNDVMLPVSRRRVADFVNMISTF
jgi:two-component system LytT family response regulator